MIKMGVMRRDVNVQDAPLFLAGDNRNANWLKYGFHQVDEIYRCWEMIL